MKSFAIGVLGAIVAIVLFFTGFVLGIDKSEQQFDKDVANMQKAQVSAQMQCINWVDNWRTLVVGDPRGQGAPPTFGMYVQLCGKPDSK